MDRINMRLDLKYLEMKKKLDIAEYNNQRVRELRIRKEKLELKQTRIDEEIQMLKLIRKGLKKERINVKEERTVSLEQKLQDELKLFFPERDYTVNFFTENKRDTDHTELLMREGNSEEIHLEGAEGAFFRQQVGLTITSFVNRITGVGFLVLDEVLSNADKYKVKKLRDILDKITDSSNIIYIEHKEGAYMDIPNRREIYLKYDSVNQCTQIMEVKDYE